MDFGHLLYLWLFALGSVQWVKETSKVWLRCGFYRIVVFVRLLTLVPYSSSFVVGLWLQVTGWRGDGIRIVTMSCGSALPLR